MKMITRFFAHEVEVFLPGDVKGKLMSGAFESEPPESISHFVHRT